MKETLTIKEIENRFDSEWVLLDDPRTDKKNNVKSGKVLAHSANRDELYREAIRLKPRHAAILFTGEVVPKGTAVIL